MALDKLQTVCGVSGLACLISLLCNPHPSLAAASGAAAHANVSNGVITGITITNGGTDYSTTPTIFITDSEGGTGASATATISDGSIVEITVLTGGTGYNDETTSVTILPGTTSYKTKSLMIADLNGDGRPDIITEDDQNQFFWNRNDVIITMELNGKVTRNGAIQQRALLYPITKQGDTAFDNWLKDQFDSNSGVLSTADNDSDGVPNLVEYAFGLDPTTPQSNKLLEIRHDHATPEIVLEYTIHRFRTDVSIRVQACTKLGQHWTYIGPTSPNARIEVVSVNGNFETRRVTIKKDGPRQFLRLAVERK